MTIEEKAKAYDRALEKAKILLKIIGNATLGNLVMKNEFKNMFPELAESEDERIRKHLIKHFGNKSKEEWNGVPVKDILSWLEKQGEQKPADNSNYLLSWSENEEKMLQCLEGIVKDYWAKAEQEKNELKIREASNVSFFLKTIHKQPLCWIKCSDRLPNKDGIYLVVTDGMHNDVYDMARYDSIEGWHKASEIIYWMPIPQLNDKSIIEQKPSEWSEEDEEQLQHTIAAIQWYAGGTDIIDWIKSLKDRVQLQPKKEWSEEDRNKIADYLYCLNVGFTQIAAKQRAKDICDLLRPQTTWKPSDEQIRALSILVNIPESASDTCRKTAQELLEQLRKLKG